MVVLTMTVEKMFARLVLYGVLVAASGLIVMSNGAEQPDPEERDRIINIVAERFTFVPSQIKLKQGEVVELRIRSLDTNHGFRIREAGIDVIVPKRGKGDARILFRAQEKSTTILHCIM